MRKQSKGCLWKLSVEKHTKNTQTQREHTKPCGMKGKAWETKCHQSLIKWELLGFTVTCRDSN